MSDRNTSVIVTLAVSLNKILKVLRLSQYLSRCSDEMVDLLITQVKVGANAIEAHGELIDLIVVFGARVDHRDASRILLRQLRC